MLSWSQAERESAPLIVALYLLTVYHDFVDAKFEFEGRVGEANLKLANLEEMIVLNGDDFEGEHARRGLHLID